MASETATTTASPESQNLFASAKRMRDRWLTDPGVTKLFQNKWFWVVLAVKVVMGTFLASTFMRELFVPFTNYFVSSGFQNPYEHFVSIGRTNLFPYPPMMLFFLSIPRLLLGPLMVGGVDTVTPLHLFALHLPLLASDVVIAIILARWFPNKTWEVFLLYWCSPFVIYVTYWHGQLDSLPMAVCLCSMHLLKHRKYALAMLAYGLAIATKSHLLIVAPYIFVYIVQDVGWARAARYIGVFAATASALVLPVLFGVGFRTMVLNTEESQRVFAFRAPIGDGLSVLIAPLVIILMWFRFVAYPKRNWDLFLLYLGLVFGTFMLLAPPRPGYILWSLPFFLVILLQFNQKLLPAYALAICSYFAYFWSSTQSDFFDAWRLVSPAFADLQGKYQVGFGNGLFAPHNMSDLSFTLLQASLGTLTLSMYLFGVRSNAVYKLRTKPVMIGLAGDSGSGKDEASKLLQMLVGDEKLSIIPGDDYHKWPRGHEMWKVYSHLDVRGNNLHSQVEHALAISAGNAIEKVHYDHNTGKFTEKETLDPSQFVLFQGLHSLSILQLREMYDLAIFLDPDEDLRRHWKITRDVKNRGHAPEKVLESIEARAKDRAKYIITQRDNADIIFSWRPLHEIDPNVEITMDDLELDVRALNSFDFHGLADRLEEAGIKILDFEPYIDSRWQMIRMTGQIKSETLYDIATDIIPAMEEITVEPVFADNLNGCLQLILLAGLSTKLRYNANQQSAVPLR